MRHRHAILLATATLAAGLVLGAIAGKARSSEVPIVPDCSARLDAIESSLGASAEAVAAAEDASVLRGNLGALSASQAGPSIERLVSAVDRGEIEVETAGPLF